MKGIVLFCICFTGLASVKAQNEYNFYGKGARAAGMSYAFNAISDDAFAMSFNTAGMAQIKKPELAFARSMKVTNYTSEIYHDINYDAVFNLDYLGFVYPIKFKKRNLALGLNYQTLMNFKEKYSRDTKDENTSRNYINRLTVNTVSLSGAYTVTRYLSLGVSLNTWFSLGNKSDFSAFYRGLNDDNEIYETIYRERIKHKYSGVDMSAGFFMDFTTFNFPLRFAFNWRSESIIKNQYSDSYKMTDIYVTTSDTIIYTNLREGPKKYYFHRIFQTGVSYRIGEYLTIACDFDYRPFKNSGFTWDYHQYNDFNIPVIDTTRSEAFYISESNANLHQFRIGAEYILHPDFALIPVRIGWKNNPTSLTDYGENGELNNQVRAHSFNAGIGWVMKFFTIDFAYEWYEWERYEAPWTDSDGGIHYDYEKRIDYLFVLSMIIHL